MPVIALATFATLVAALVSVVCKASLGALEFSPCPELEPTTSGLILPVLNKLDQEPREESEESEVERAAAVGDDAGRTHPGEGGTARLLRLLEAK